MDSVERIRISTVVNGRPWEGEIPVHEVLAVFLRERLRLTGTKISCASEVCGACAVLLDGEPVSSCTVLALEARGRSIETVEGLSTGDELTPLQEAFVRNVAVQCGFCTPGQLVTATSLLRRSVAPTHAEIVEYMHGNICRCGCYPAIAQSIREAATSPRGS